MRTHARARTHLARAWRGACAVECVVAVVENSNFEVGAACLDTGSMAVRISQFCDDQAYSKALSVLAQHAPRTLLFPDTRERKDALLERIATAECEGARVVH